MSKPKYSPEEAAQRIEFHLSEIKAIKRRKTRSDLGKAREKYNSELPFKYKSYLLRANKKQMKFDLSVDEFNHLTSMCCVFCGSNNKIGIDRIDSSEGYVKGNIQPCCTTCNIMKYTYSSDQFVMHVKRILNHLSSNDLLNGK